MPKVVNGVKLLKLTLPLPLKNIVYKPYFAKQMKEYFNKKIDT